VGEGEVGASEGKDGVGEGGRGGDEGEEGGGEGSGGEVGVGADGEERAARPDKRYANGRSKKRTGTPCSTAQRIACHSGENTANGQNAARRGSSVA
jgi:hypothetical protein